MGLTLPPLREQSPVKKAVVIGGSLSGCLVAQVLSEHFSEVVILEKDQFDATTAPRKGVPQEHHLHLVLKQGMDIIESIFPGISHALNAEGGVPLNLGRDLRWFQGGEWKVPYLSGLTSTVFSRSLLDKTLRQRILSNPRVTVSRHTRVSGLICNGTRVEGVTLSREGGEEALRCELVVDCSGFGTKTPQWLKAHGLGDVQISTLKKHTHYSSQLYRCTGVVDTKAVMIWDQGSNKHDVGLLFPIEKDIWLVSAAGCFESNPTHDVTTYKAFIDALAQPDISDFIARAVPVSELSNFRFGGSTWRHYEKMSHFPDGLLVVGAAFCNLNPYFAQGLTMCASHVKVLREHLTQGLPARALQKKLARVSRTPWDMAEVEDLRHSRVEGQRTLFKRFLMAYVGMFYTLSNHNTFARELQLKVMHQVASPYALFHPSIVMRIAGMACLSAWRAKSSVRKASSHDTPP